VLPTALTGTPTNITTTSAILRGSVTDNGGAATLTASGLVYVRGTGLPTTADIIAGGGGNAYSAYVTGLTPGTTYTYQSYGTNSAGTSYGNPISFTTLTNTSVVAISRADSNPINASTNPTSASNVRYTVTFAAPVVGLTAGNFAFTTTGLVFGPSVVSVSGAGTTYTVTVYVLTGAGTSTLGLNLVNTTGVNPGVTNPLPFVGEVYTFDRTAPTATISTTAGSSTSTAPIPFTVTFSEPVSGFTASGLSVSNGTVTTAVTSAGNAYSFGVTPTASGAVTVSVPAGAAQDAAGNGNPAAGPLSVTYAPVTTAPTVTLLSPPNGPVGTSVTITGTNLGGTMAVSFNGTATSLTAIVAAGTTTGPVQVTTPSGSATSAISFVVRVAPTTVPDAYTTPLDVLLAGNVLSNDLGTNLQAILIIRPTHGTLALNPDGTFTYQSTAGYVGADSFLYYACTMGVPLVCGDPATVSITVTPATSARVATTAQPTAKAGTAAAGAAPELVLTSSPNPFAEQLRVRFALPTAQAYTLTVYDGQGRLVQQLASGQAEAGQAQQVEVPTSSYATGHYLVRLTTATGS
jgi:hypothetical protein